MRPVRQNNPNARAPRHEPPHEVDAHEESPVGTADGYYDPRFDTAARSRRPKAVEPPESDLDSSDDTFLVDDETDTGSQTMRSVFSPDRPATVEPPRVRIVAEPSRPQPEARPREPRESFRRLRPVVPRDPAAKAGMFTTFAILIALAAATLDVLWNGWGKRAANQGSDSPALSLIYRVAQGHLGWGTEAMGLLAPLMLAIAIVAVYAVVRTIGGAFFGVLATLLFIASSGVLVDTSLSPGLMSATAIATVAVACLLQWWRNGQAFCGIASGALFALAIAFEPAFVFFVLLVAFVSAMAWEWTKPAQSALRALAPLATLVACLVTWHAGVGTLGLGDELRALPGTFQLASWSPFGSVGLLAVATVGALALLARRPALGTVATLWLICAAFVMARSDAALPVWPPLLVAASYGLWRILHAAAVDSDEPHGMRVWRQVSTSLIAGVIVAIGIAPWPKVIDEPVPVASHATIRVVEVEVPAPPIIQTVTQTERFYLPEGAVVLHDAGDIALPVESVPLPHDVVVLAAGNDLGESILRALEQNDEVFLLMSEPLVRTFREETLPRMPRTTASQAGTFNVEGSKTPLILLRITRKPAPQKMYFA